MPKVVLIDNYDSFTWNLYEYLCRDGADVIVYRNDKVTIAAIEADAPDIIMISPGPGHPDTDSGISKDVFKHFMGKLPVFGVCMGLQCIVSEMGGSIEYAGEIVHGKTSAITHDGRGCFQGLSQQLNVTRYHSLAANIVTLPDGLEVSARTKSGVIQGVRHKKYIVEGVQFHPESIMSQEGRQMLRNVLNYRGGEWSSNSKSQPAQQDKKSILVEIYDQRRKDVAHQQGLPGKSFGDLKKSLELGLAPSLVDFYERVSTPMSLIAEIKRASPSKGMIGMGIHAPTQAQIYADAGASAISVLTEPTWFKGSIDDLSNVRRAVDKFGEHRPAILRKEFIFSTYQIAEARLAGADTVLLIVKMLDDQLLKELYDYSGTLGMEPLVEVSSLEEMKRAVVLKARVIGVNNRDLHSFNVDMSNTSKLVGQVPNGTILIALSGIYGRDQVKTYEKEGVHAILVGESLMRSADPAQFVKELIEKESD